MRVESRSIVMSSNDSNIKQDIYPPIQLDKNAAHELSLLNLDMYNSMPNIDEHNNLFIYKVDDEKFTIEFPTGAYEIESINAFLKRRITEDLFDITANHTTLKCIITIKRPNVSIIFNHKRSLRLLLGFNKEVLREVGEYEGNAMVDILPVNSILVNCDLIEGSYLQGIPTPVLYSFFPDAPPGYKINERSNTPIYLPVTLPSINSIHVWLTDQDRKPLNLRGERITLRLQLKSTYFSKS